MTDELAGKVIEAYRSNPILTGLLLLNIGVFVGMGWYVMKVQQATGVYVSKLHDDLVTLARECRD